MAIRLLFTSTANKSTPWYMSINEPPSLLFSFLNHPPMPFSDQPRRPCRVLLPWRNIPTSTRRSRRLPTVRLGDKGRPRSFLVRAFRRVRLRWLRLQKSCMLRKLKAFYSALIRDLLEASATMEAMQSRMMMETYFAAPVLPVSVASLPPTHGSSPYRA